jgi:hypothetical protein
MMKKILLVAIGLGLGQLFPFVIIPTPTWMLVDKLLFGLSFGVAIAGLLSVLSYRRCKSCKKKK